MEKINERRTLKNRAVRFLVEKAQKVCSNYFEYDYEYSPSEAIEELGISVQFVYTLIVIERIPL